MSRRAQIVLAFGVFATVLVAAVLSVLNGRNNAPGDPESARVNGYLALAEVLRGQGVEVEIARSSAQLAAAEPDADTTLVVVNPEDLGGNTLEELTALTPGRLVFVGWTPPVAKAFDSSPPTLGTAENLTGECTGSLKGALDDLTIDRPFVEVAPSAHGCFPTDGGWVVAAPSDQLVVVASRSLWTNGEITDADQAAIALRLLGRHPRVVWYVPSLGDVEASQGFGVVPRAVGPSLLLATLAFGVFAWRSGRRLGPLVQEDLPVVVPSLETVRSRGHLYHATGASAYAFSTLQRASRQRWARRLQRDPDSPELATLVAEATGRPLQDVGPLLDPATTITSTTDLVAFVTRLTELDKELPHG